MEAEDVMVVIGVEAGTVCSLEKPHL